jgi:hypothetical protein
MKEPEEFLATEVLKEKGLLLLLALFLLQEETLLIQ